MEALLDVLQGGSNISTFEFLTSGTVAKLKDYLLGAPFLCCHRCCCCRCPSSCLPHQVVSDCQMLQVTC